MFKKFPIPHSFSLIRKGKVFLLLKDEYKDDLLQQGIDELETLLKVHRDPTYYLGGRTPHPSIPIKEGKRMLIRRYSHGGLLRVLNRNLYFFGSRSFQELVVTEKIRSIGIPTIQPIGAIHQPVLPHLYQACLISLEIPYAINLFEYFQGIGLHPPQEKLLAKRGVLRAAGRLLRQFHQAGFFHGDLQLKNILKVGEQLFLIDFDKTYQKPSLSIKERIKNLLRLNRSVEKWNRLRQSLTRTDCWRFFLAYAGNDKKIRQAMKKALRTHSIRSFFYRCGWSLEKRIGNK